MDALVEIFQLPALSVTLNQRLVTNVLISNKCPLQAEEFLQEGLAVAREIRQLGSVSSILIIWGELHLKQQELETASKAFLSALEKAQKSSRLVLVATAQFGLARVAASQDNIIEACRLGQKSLDILEAIGHRKAAKVKHWLDKLPSRNLVK